MTTSHIEQVTEPTPILSNEEILALRSEAALLLHNELRDASIHTLQSNEILEAQSFRIKRGATLALIESFIASALGTTGNKINSDVIGRHTDTDYARTSKSIW